VDHRPDVPVAKGYKRVCSFPCSVKESFACRHCVRCCTATYSLRDVEEGLQYRSAREKMARTTGLCWDAPDDRLCLLLFNDEVKHLQDYAIRHGISFHPVPLLYALDDNTGGAVVLCWTLDHATCPFLTEETEGPRCAVHAVKPLVCRAFPVVRREGQNTYALSELCTGCQALLPVNEALVEERLGPELQAARAVDRRMTELLTRFAVLREMHRIRPRLTDDLDGTGDWVRSSVLARRYAPLEEIS